MFSRREILIGGAAAALPIPGSRSARAAQAIPSDARFAAVDPQMIDDLKLLRPMDVSADNLAAFRSRPATRQAHPLPPSPVSRLPLKTVTIPGLAGQPPVGTVQFDPGPRKAGRGAVVWMHGGGYVAGAAGIPVALREAALANGWLVVSVDYRLAPEARLTASLADNYAALRWVHGQADVLGVDRARIAVGGASAGGGHAAMLALAARDRGEVPLACQVLIYPMLDDRTGSSRPARPGTGEFVWTAASNRFGWSSLLGVPAGSAGVLRGVVPGRRNDLAGLPPAFIGVGTLDLFLDEDIAYAGALTAAGVAVDLAIVPGAFHAFDGIAPTARASRAFTARWVAGLTAALT